MARADTKAPKVGELAVHAEALHSAVSSYASLIPKAQKLQGLTVRQQELLNLVEAAEALACSARIVAEATGANLGGSIAGLDELRAALAELAKRVHRDITAITDAKAISMLKADRALASAREAIRVAWQRWALQDFGETGPESVLMQYPTFRAKAREVQRLRENLTKLAARPPEGTGDVEAVRDARSQLSMALAEMAGADLDTDVADFLRTAATTGYSLEDLLVRPALVAWIQRYGLATTLFIRAR